MKISANDLLALTKPRLVLLAALASGVSFWIASDRPLDTKRMLFTFTGSFLIGAAASVFNQLIERGEDARMKRTENRPLPAGRISIQNAALFGCVLVALGFGLLIFTVNLLSAGLGLLTLAIYLGLYTPLKRLTAWNTLVGAVPGALPCLMGWAGARNHLDPEAFTLFMILFLWQMPHFFAISWVYREEYRAAGFRMLSTEDASGRRTTAQILFFSTALVLFSFLPAREGWAGHLYGLTAVSAGAALIMLAIILAFTRLRFARGFATVSIYYLIVLICGFAVDRL